MYNPKLKTAYFNRPDGYQLVGGDFHMLTGKVDEYGDVEAYCGDSESPDNEFFQYGEWDKSTQWTGCKDCYKSYSGQVDR